MAIDRTTYFISNQFPEYIRSEYPKFIEFIETYYDFVDQTNLRIENLRDIDTVPEKFSLFFRREFMKHFPSSFIDDKRLFAVIRDLYATKGTIDGLNLLFRIFSNSDIIVRHPSERILRVSDGRWIQNNLITLYYTDISLESGSKERLYLSFSDYKNTYKIPIDTYEIYSDKNRIRLSSRITSKIFLISDSVEASIINENDDVLVSGFIIETANAVKIIEPGRNWKVGQILVIQSSDRNMIIQIKSVDSNGGITNAEMIDHGIGISDTTTFITTPYTSGQVVNENDVTVHEHTITINDYIYNVGDTITGDMETANNLSKENVIYSSCVYGDQPNAPILPPNFTTNDLLSTQTIITLVPDKIAKEKGNFVTDNGIIGNPWMRLQDNFFYQMFSYLIETTEDINTYKDILFQMHPIGTKFFSNYNNERITDVSSTIEIIGSIGEAITKLNDNIIVSDIIELVRRIAFDESVSVNDSTEIYLSRTVNDSVSPSDGILSMSIVEPITRHYDDSININDGTDTPIVYAIQYADNYFAEDYDIREYHITA